MKVVFIGCKSFKGKDICGFEYSFYEKNIKVGDIFEVSEHYDDNLSNIFNDGSSVIHIDTEHPFKFRGSFPIKHFISLEQYRNQKLELLGI
jgi:CTP-dependent riboflavin kinase